LAPDDHQQTGFLLERSGQVRIGTVAKRAHGLIPA
jgi:hypothetical protein